MAEDIIPPEPEANPGGTLALEEFEPNAPLAAEMAVDADDKNAADLAPVFDVPVHISAVLGRASLSVAQLLKLGQGSVLELDRKVGEAIDIYVNNPCLVARGEGRRGRRTAGRDHDRNHQRRRRGGLKAWRETELRRKPMRLLVVGRLNGQLSNAAKMAMSAGAKVAHVETCAAATHALRAGQGADLLMVDFELDIRALIAANEQELNASACRWSPVASARTPSAPRTPFAPGPRNSSPCRRTPT